jgi:SEC-C motif domain protein
MKKPSSTANNILPCHCGSGLLYPRCCGRWHAGPEHLAAPTALALMRSRYSAYALNLTDYLLATWHPSTRPAALESQPAEMRWLGLEIRRYEQQDADHARVEFVARSKLGGRAHRLVELSRFERVLGRWVYVGAVDEVP